MSGITAFLESIAQFFVAILTFITNAVMGIIQLLRMLPSILSMLSYSINRMPNIVSTFLLAMVMVSITYIIIGR